MLTTGFCEGTHGREDSTAHRGGWKLSRVQGTVDVWLLRVAILQTPAASFQTLLTRCNLARS